MKRNDDFESARALLHPSPVRSSHEPRWFTQAIQGARRSVHDTMIKKVKEIEPKGFVPRFDASDHVWGYSHIGLWCLIERLVEEASSMEDWIRYLVDRLGPESSPPKRRTKVDWFDHAGSTTWGKTRAWVSEPYPHVMTAENLRQIELVANLAKLHSGVDANSWHNPGHTIRIVFWEKDAGAN